MVIELLAVATELLPDLLDERRRDRVAAVCTHAKALSADGRENAVVVLDMAIEGRKLGAALSTTRAAAIAVAPFVLTEQSLLVVEVLLDGDGRQQERPI